MPLLRDARQHRRKIFSFKKIFSGKSPRRLLRQFDQDRTHHDFAFHPTYSAAPAAIPTIAVVPLVYVAGGFGGQNGAYWPLLRPLEVAARNKAGISLSHMRSESK
jgi:hypothetical protein